MKTCIKAGISLLFGLALLTSCGNTPLWESDAACPAVSPEPVPAVSYNPASTPIPAPVPASFSMVWLSDTQTMSFEYPEALDSMGKWIANNRRKKNIRCVVHTGDIVENGFAPRHWENFNRCYRHFRGSIPYVPIAGNHDIAVKRHDYAAYLERSFFADYPKKALFQGGKALYREIWGGCLKLLLIGAGWDAELEAADWMNQVIASHPDHAVILLFHGYIGRDGGFTVVGKKMYEQVVLPNKNVKLVLCGHSSGLNGVRVHEIDDDGDGLPDRKVHALMYNYQDQRKSESGQLRMLSIDPPRRTLTVTTYSPYNGRYYKD